MCLGFISKIKRLFSKAVVLVGERVGGGGFRGVAFGGCLSRLAVGD